MRSFTIILTPDRARPDFFVATLDGALLCVSREPLCAGARELALRGAPADAMLVIRHVGSDTDAMRARLGDAARFTVREETKDGRPRLVPWKAPPGVRLSPPMRYFDEPAPLHRIEPRQRMGGAS